MLSITTAINKIFTRGRKEKQNYNFPENESLRFEYMQRHIITNAILISGFFMTIYFAMFFPKSVENFVFELFVAAILFTSFIMRRFWGGGSKNFYKLYAETIPIGALCILFAWLYFRGGSDGVVGIWILLVPIISIFVLGKVIGMIITVIIWFWILVCGFIPGDETHFAYNASTTMRYFWAYFIILLLTFTYEHIRLRHHKQIFDMYNSLKKRNSDLEKLGLFDQLAEIYSMHTLEIVSERLLKLAAKENKPLSFVMLDFDNFKKFNEFHGNEAGDNALKTLAETLKFCACRPLDILARINGDRFGMLFFDTGLKQAAWIAKKLCADIELQLMKLPDGSIDKITVSIGVASQIPDEDSQLSCLFDAAGENLKKAKANGKNQVVAE